MEELDKIHDKMRELEKTKTELEEKLSEIYAKNRVIHAQTLKDVSFAKDEDGKPLYSNQKLRDAELTIRLSENKEYERTRKLRDEVRYICFELNLLVDKKSLLLGRNCEGQKYLV